MQFLQASPQEKETNVLKLSSSNSRGEIGEWINGFSAQIHSQVKIPREKLSAAAAAAAD